MLETESQNAQWVHPLLHAVCRVYALTPEDVWRTDRREYVTEARQVCGYLLMREARLTCAQVEPVLRRDHSTVLHGNKRIAALVERGLRADHADNHVLRHVIVR